MPVCVCTRACACVRLVCMCVCKMCVCQVIMGGRYDLRADMFALGLTLAELVCTHMAGIAVSGDVASRFQMAEAGVLVCVCVSACVHAYVLVRVRAYITCVYFCIVPLLRMDPIAVFSRVLALSVSVDVSCEVRSSPLLCAG